MKHISFSQISCFNRCKQEYRYKYVDNIRMKKTSEALTFGKLFHLGLEVLYKTNSINEAIQVVYDSIENVESDDDSWLKVCLEAMLSGYYEHFYSNDMGKYKVIELEKSYEEKIRLVRKTARGYRFKFISDAVFEDEEHNLWLVEYKTTSRIGEAYYDRLKIDHQITGNLSYLQDIYGKPFSGVIYRIMKKPTIRQKQTESELQFLERLSSVFREDPENYFIELKITRTQEEIAEFKQHLWNALQDIRSTIKHNRFYKNTTACAINSCTYLPLCSKKEGYRELYEKKQDYISDIIEGSIENE